MSSSKSLLLTGASGGIGLALADLFLKSGQKKVYFQFRSFSEPLVALLNKYGLDSKQYLIQADLKNEGDVAKMRETIEAHGDSVSVLLNLAGASTNSMSWKLSLKDFHDVIDANLTSTFLCCREFLPSMRQNEFGRIINFSSIVASMGTVGASHYAAAKAGIEGLTRSIAQEVASKNITVNAIALGYFDRGLIHSVPSGVQELIKSKILVGRFGKPEELFGLVQVLADENCGYTTGQVFHVNGGLYLK